MHTQSHNNRPARGRLTLLIPNSIPAADRRKALRKAMADARRHQIIMQHTARRHDLGAYRHARHMYDMARDAVIAWESVQIGEEAA